VLSKRAENAIRNQVRNVIREINGIGESKLESRNSSGERSIESGHKISPKVHSIKSIENLRRELGDLARYAKIDHGIGKFTKIDGSIIRSWINSKDIGYRTASNYLSNLNKISNHLGVTREEIREIRKDLSPELKRPMQQTRAYKHLDRISLPERAIPAFRLQRDYGLRAGAATHINLDKQLIGNTLHYREKGGKWSQKTLDKDLVKELHKNAQNGSYRINYKTYSRDLQKSIQETGQEYNGTHGVRHSYAQNELENGKTLEEVSNQMGHVRSEITLTYLR